MKEKYIIEITQFIQTLDDKKLLYILTLLKKIFGCRS